MTGTFRVICVCAGMFVAMIATGCGDDKPAPPPKTPAGKPADKPAAAPAETPAAARPVQPEKPAAPAAPVKPPAAALPPANLPMVQRLEMAKAQWLEKADDAEVKLVDAQIAKLTKSKLTAQALKVGSKAADFELPDATGKDVMLSQLLKKGPVVLVWYRGAWCPYCTIQLEALKKAAPEIHRRGATLVAVSPQTPAATAATAKRGGLGFTLLSDEGNFAARKYGLNYALTDELAKIITTRADLRKVNGDASNELPLTAAYVIDAKGVIQWAFLNPDHRLRADVAEILKALDALKPKPAPK